jgi:hypothetical protein
MPRVREGEVIMNLRVPAELRRALKHYAVDAGKPVEAVVREALGAWVGAGSAAGSEVTQ